MWTTTKLHEASASECNYQLSTDLKFTHLQYLPSHNLATRLGAKTLASDFAQNDLALIGLLLATSLAA